MLQGGDDVSDKQWKEFAGQVIRALPDDLSKERIQYWITNSYGLRTVLRDALSVPYSTWREVHIAACSGIQCMLSHVADGKHRVTTQALSVLRKVLEVPLPSSSVVRLVKPTVRELGYRSGSNYHLLRRDAMRQGLELCPPELGYSLLFTYRDQPEGEEVMVASELLNASDGSKHQFVVSTREGVRELDAVRVNDLRLGPDAQVVFVES